jgi:hypothetical protein
MVIDNFYFARISLRPLKNYTVFNSIKSSLYRAGYIDAIDLKHLLFIIDSIYQLKNLYTINIPENS